MNGNDNVKNVSHCLYFLRKIIDEYYEGELSTEIGYIDDVLYGRTSVQDFKSKCCNNINNLLTIKSLDYKYGSIYNVCRFAEDGDPECECECEYCEFNDKAINQFR